jgi:hypothetical protein
MLRAVLLAVVFAICACGPAGDEGPARTVRRFVALMDRSGTEPAALREAYGLLDAKARASLQRRASEATTLSGRPVEPWEMLARGRFWLRLPLGRGVRERIDGDRARVIVAEGDARAEVPLVREKDGWKIVLAIPESTGAAAPDAGSR